MALAGVCSAAPLCALPQSHSRTRVPCSLAPSSRSSAPHRRRRSAAAAAASGSNAGGGSSSTAAREAAVTKDYIKWAGEAGIVSPKVTQAYFGELRGAKALDAIAPDEIFVTVPRGAAVVVAPNERCPCPDFVDPAFYKEAPWFVKMALLLLWERSRGRASPVWGYIEQLPSSIDTPVRWSEAELEELQYAPAIKEIRQQQAAWRQQYDKFCAAAKQGKHSYEDFLWALENVRSRAFSGPYTGSSVGEKARTLGLLLAAGGAYAAWQQLPLEQALNGLISVLVFNIIYDLLLSKKLKWYALCPVVDAINHSSLVESNVEYEYFRDQFVLSTKSAYRAGEQVFISYGAQSNGSLLQYYAFTEPNNPNDVYAFDAAVGGQKLQASLQDEQLRTVLVQAAEAELASKPTSAADDERLLQTAHLMSPRQRAAAEFRLEKKRVLERAICRSRKRLGKQAAAA
ncbi:hypothetical protein COHA_007528 [Chlorella ohadii]|uniref:SET domain-containing protein n=1 Tax=Chlorella ohadii TaxID=2649997 RepID=A0AAD5H469_9CHLO|nr:hypothetical protein COHA_007528 [Chlorella ohadii]